MSSSGREDDPNAPTRAPAPIAGVHHLAVTVSSLRHSTEWYVRNLDFEPLTEMSTSVFEAVVLRHSAGMVLKLMQHRSPVIGDFDERRVGLDHLGFAVETSDDVERWARRLDAAGVENTGVKPGAFPDSHLVVFRDPDGVQLEIYSSSA